MFDQDNRINVAILAVPEVTASALFGMFDLFSSPGRDWSFIVTGEAGEQRMHPYVVARSTDGFLAANGIWVNPDYGFSDCPSPHIVCIPDFFVNPGESVAGMYEPEARWLKRSHEDGAMLASACSGAVLLGEAGLLVDCEATIHWGYVATLSNNYPGVRVRVDRSLVLSGEAQRIVMAGGGSSWQDLALYLIARFVGLKEAMEVAKVYMLQWHDLGQQPFASLMRLRQSTDAVINKCQEWLAMNYKTRAPVAAMVALSGLPERSFIRRFTKAAGMTPLNYVHALRLEEAKQMLETADLSIEAIANEAGYEDTSFFGRLFRRETGMTPAHYRLRFSSLRRALKQT
ncbi:MAG: helix-turn-helix domain-containing protein [Rhizobium sp.]|uniref:GlxA family transcriptional regulator n=1 Tax=Rhizobium sp. TaxID=391 RepID=UPI00056762A6